jgi:membrane protein involved in colicin uptake
MENKVVNLELKTNVDESIAGLKALKRQLKDTAAGSEEFKKIYNQIDDLEDKIKSSKKASADWVDSLEQAGGPLGMLGAGINRAKVATQSFGGALKATGIGLIVSLLGGLVAAFSENEGAMKKIQPLLDGLKKIFQGVFRAVEPLFDTFIDLATDALPYVSKGIGMVYSAMMAYFTFIKESGTGVMKILKGVFTLDGDAISAGIDQVGGSFKKTQQSYGDSMKRFSEGSKELTKTEKEEAEKREENRKKALEKQQENERKAKEKSDELLRKKAEEKKKYDDDTNAGLEVLRKAQLEKDLQDSANKRGLLDEQIALLNEGVDAVQASETKKNEVTAESAKATIAQEQSIADAKKSIQESAFNNISNGIGLLKGLFEKNKGLQKALLVAESAAGIAKIIINTRAANAAARLKYSLLPGGAALAAAESTMNNVSAGISIAANLAATSKALSALGGGGAANSSGGAGGSESGGGAPSFNVVGQGGANQIAQSIAGQEQQPLKAFVVSNDVTTSQSLNRNIVNNASLG